MLKYVLKAMHYLHCKHMQSIVKIYNYINRQACADALTIETFDVRLAVQLFVKSRTKSFLENFKPPANYILHGSFCSEPS